MKHFLTFSLCLGLISCVNAPLPSSNIDNAIPVQSSSLRPPSKGSTFDPNKLAPDSLPDTVKGIGKSIFLKGKIQVATEDIFKVELFVSSSQTPTYTAESGEDRSYVMPSDSQSVSRMDTGSLLQLKATAKNNPYLVLQALLKIPGGSGDSLHLEQDLNAQTTAIALLMETARKQNASSKALGPETYLSSLEIRTRVNELAEKLEPLLSTSLKQPLDTILADELNTAFKAIEELLTKQVGLGEKG